MAIYNSSGAFPRIDEKMVNNSPVVLKAPGGNTQAVSSDAQQAFRNIFNYKKTDNSAGETQKSGDALGNILNYRKKENNPAGVPIAHGVGLRRADSFNESKPAILSVSDKSRNSGNNASGVIDTSPRVGVRDYFADKSGFKVDWNDESKDVLVNGQAIPKDKIHIENGRSYVSKNYLDNLYKSMSDEASKVNDSGYLANKPFGAVPIREHFSGNDDAKVSWDGVYNDVTINDRAIPKNKVHIDNGVSYADADFLDSFYKDTLGNTVESGNLRYAPEGGVGAREYAGRFGADVSWDEESGNLLINGHVVPKSEVYLKDGKSYVNEDVLNNILNYSETYTPSGNLKQPSKNAVRIVDYIKNRPDAKATYSESTGDVYLNGIRIPKESIYIDGDGRSFVDESILTSIYNKSVEDNADSFFNAKKRITDADELLAKLYKEVANPEKFSYDYREDPNFKVYSEYYDDLADRAVSDAVAQMVGRTGGYLNSNALAAAYQMRNMYNQQKANIIPTLEKQAFDKWLAGRELNASQMQALGNVLDAFNNTYLTARDNENNINIERENAAENSRQFDEQIALAEREMQNDILLSDKEIEFKNRELDEMIRQFDKNYNLDIASVIAKLRDSGYTDERIINAFAAYFVPIENKNGAISQADLDAFNIMHGITLPGALFEAQQAQYVEESKKYPFVNDVNPLEANNNTSNNGGGSSNNSSTPKNKPKNNSNSNAKNNSNNTSKPTGNKGADLATGLPV